MMKLNIPKRNVMEVELRSVDSVINLLPDDEQAVIAMQGTYFVN